MITGEIVEDFTREVWCLLGLPFDAVDIEQTAEKIFQAAADNRQCVVSTPNLNFAVTALSDSEFRDTVIFSELSLLDGMPLLWVARFLGLGVTEKVSGSDLFDHICSEENQDNVNLSVFFFGGEEGAAKVASENMNSGKGAVSCEGYLNPGFGPIDSLSSPEIISKINHSRADFLVVALGARKGQLWIERNRTKLNIPVISHLGAVVNFAAGKVRRAPRWMQLSGLEWIWRILQEPTLWRRYWSDGLVFLHLVFAKILPYALWKKIYSQRYLVDQGWVEVHVESGPNKSTISISGSCFHDTLEPLRAVFSEQVENSRNVIVNLAAVPMVDAAFLGLCLVLKKHVNRAGGKLSFSGLNPKVIRVFHWNCVEFLL
jgi:N-acetylglucosaminyldiphosphoundecaprenol N-acetyl-beta-D-mannosaminyltransferase